MFGVRDGNLDYVGELFERHHKKLYIKVELNLQTRIMESLSTIE